MTNSESSQWDFWINILQRKVLHTDHSCMTTSSKEFTFNRINSFRIPLRLIHLAIPSTKRKFQFSINWLITQTQLRLACQIRNPLTAFKSTTLLQLLFDFWLINAHLINRWHGLLQSNEPMRTHPVIHVLQPSESILSDFSDTFSSILQLIHMTIIILFYAITSYNRTLVTPVELQWCWHRWWHWYRRNIGIPWFLPQLLPHDFLLRISMTLKLIHQDILIHILFIRTFDYDFATASHVNMTPLEFLLQHFRWFITDIFPLLNHHFHCSNRFG